jgi:hypothetical protein
MSALDIYMEVKSAKSRRKLLAYANGRNQMRWNCLHAVILLPYLVTALSAQLNKALATQYLECVRNAEGKDVASRKEQTPVFATEDGTRAYGVAAAEYGSGTCKNTSFVYIAKPQRPFVLLFKQVAEPLPDGTVYDGNGIQAIRWSPSGKWLLIEISQWAWGTDSTFHTKYLLLHRGENAPRQIMPEETIWKRFTHRCQMSNASRGWTDNSHIEFEVSPSQTKDEEGVPDPEPPCVKQMTRFSFDVVSQTLRP